MSPTSDTKESGTGRCYWKPGRCAGRQGTSGNTVIYKVTRKISVLMQTRCIFCSAHNLLREGPVVGREPLLYTAAQRFKLPFLLGTQPCSGWKDVKNRLHLRPAMRAAYISPPAHWSQLSPLATPLAARKTQKYSPGRCMYPERRKRIRCASS